MCVCARARKHVCVHVCDWMRMKAKAATEVRPRLACLSRPAGASVAGPPKSAARASNWSNMPEYGATQPRAAALCEIHAGFARALGGARFLNSKGRRGAARAPSGRFLSGLRTNNKRKRSRRHPTGQIRDSNRRARVCWRGGGCTRDALRGSWRSRYPSRSCKSRCVQCCRWSPNAGRHRAGAARGGQRRRVRGGGTWTNAGRSATQTGQQ